MSDVTAAVQFKDWVTSLAIIVGGSWAIWKFGHTEWLRRRSEISSLEGHSPEVELHSVAPGRVAASLRWSWRNVGSRPVYIDTNSTFVEIYNISDMDIGFLDPRQQCDSLFHRRVGLHDPLTGFGDAFFFEPGTNSTLLTVPILPAGEAFVARMFLCANRDRHPTGSDWSFSWERWQVFRTDVPERDTAPRDK
jgi:hypothetical protein